jgi:hypothetical protein
MIDESFRCTVCGYDGLAEPPWDDDIPSDEICPSCGIQFGYDDAAGGDLTQRTLVHDDWRRRWLETGCPWASVGIGPPDEWDPVAQAGRLTGGATRDDP